MHPHFLSRRFFCCAQYLIKLLRLYLFDPLCIKYVTLFLANFDPLTLSHFVTHPRPPKSTSHISDLTFLVGLIQNPDKNPLYKFSIFQGGFCPGILSEVFSLEGFVQGDFSPFPLLSEYICYNRKLNITLNFRFHM